VAKMSLLPSVQEWSYTSATFMDSTIIGLTTFRPGSRVGDRVVGIGFEDRFSHVYAIGRTGTGKSTLFEGLAKQDMRAGSGFALFDPHGELVESAHEAPRGGGSDRVTLLGPDVQWNFNPFSSVGESVRPLAVAGMVETFRKLWSDDWGPRLEHLLRNVVWTVLEAPGSTLADVPPLLTDRKFRERLVWHLENEEVRAFWKGEFKGYSPAFRAVVTAPVLNKVGAFLSDPMVRRILTGKKSSFNLREIMDQGKILLVSLPKGSIGEGPAALLGSLLVSSLSLAALSRADVPEEERRPFFIYLDEFHTFTTLSLATMLAELRKYRVGLVLAHQYLGQLEPAVRDAVLGNVGTLISFRVGAQDAPLIARELAPVFKPEDLINLPNYHIYLRLLIDGEPSRPFSARTLSPAELEAVLRERAA